MHATLPLLQDTDFPVIRRHRLETLQVNVGYRCNQQCVHCHVNAGPRRKEEMSRTTAEEVLAFHGSSQPGAERITAFLEHEEAGVREVGWRLVGYLGATLDPRRYASAMRDDDAAVRAASKTTKPWAMVAERESTIRIAGPSTRRPTASAGFPTAASPRSPIGPATPATPAGRAAAGLRFAPPGAWTAERALLPSPRTLRSPPRSGVRPPGSRVSIT